jgi:hypothetical protein
MATNINMNVKDEIPFYIEEQNVDDYKKCVSLLKSPKELVVKKVSHSFGNNFIFNHHYLHRKIYIARNVSYGLFLSEYCIGVCLFGYPVWRQYPNLVPPLASPECPELIRLCTMSMLPKNTESFFVGKCLKYMEEDWTLETKTRPKCITSFCDISLGFDGAIYKATNFEFFKKTSGRPSNPGGAHGKWGINKDKTKAEKIMYVYWIDKKIKQQIYTLLNSDNAQ